MRGDGYGYAFWFRRVGCAVAVLGFIRGLVVQYSVNVILFSRTLRRINGLECCIFVHGEKFVSAFAEVQEMNRVVQERNRSR